MAGPREKEISRKSEKSLWRGSTNKEADGNSFHYPHRLALSLSIEALRYQVWGSVAPLSENLHAFDSVLSRALASCLKDRKFRVG